MSKPSTGISGLPAFFMVTFGEFVSLVGSNLTSFALGVWVYQRTGSATQFALASLFATLPGVLLSPIAGALVDRWERRRVMLIADLAAGLATLAVAVLFITGRLEVWHIYITATISAASTTFQWPAFSAATTLLVPKAKLSQASGLIQLSRGVAQIVAPILAGFLVAVIQIQGVILIDFATFLFAVLALSLVRFPRPEASEESKTGRGSVLSESIFGLTYIFARPGLVALLFLYAVINFSTGIVSALFTPMMLTLTTPEVLGRVMTVGGLGMLFGSIAVSAWAGPKRRVYGVIGSLLLAGAAIFVGGLQPSVWLIAVAAFGFFFSLPFANGFDQTIWQIKVPADVQGRVFAVRMMLSMSMMPLAYLAAGPLADNLFEPLMVVNGPLAASLGQIIGVGEGRGIGLLFSVMGLVIIGVTLAGLFYSRLRNIETNLSDAISDSTLEPAPMLNAEIASV